MEDKLHSLFSQMHFIEQFVESVVSYSSKYNTPRSISYSPDTIIGKPGNYPNYGDFSDTYMLRSYGKWWKKSESVQKDYMPQDMDAIETEDYITVKFEQPVIATKILLYETYNPGAIVRLWGGSGNGNWKLLWKGPPQKTSESSNIFAPPIRLLKDLIYLIRIDFNQSHLPYHTALDGVLLAGYRSRTQIQTRLFISAFLSETEKPIDKPEICNSKSNFSAFSVLPYEIIVCIFGYLDLKSLCLCAQVNRIFHNASSDTALYRQISFKRYWHLVTDNVLNSFIPKCKFLYKLDLSWCGNENMISENTFVRFLKNCEKTLTHLSLGNCSFIQKSSMKQIANCSNLIELRLRNLKLNDSNNYLVLEHLKNLKTLDLFSTNINDQSLVNILTNNPNLENLNIEICDYLGSLDIIMEILSIYNLKLRTLSCWKNSFLTSEGVKFLGKCTELRELDLGWIFMEPNDCLSHIAQSCINLTRLLIAIWRSLADHQLLSIIRHCTKLKQLDLLGVKSLSTEICDAILKSLPELEFLDISFCDSITQKQVAVWRVQHPKVTIVRSCENGSRNDYSSTDIYLV